MSEPKYTNALAKEDSLYLRQHAHNPVNWLPWGEEARQMARSENKLMIISIGYSSCHWCHVMEKESFEDEEVARLMNEHYICIKVDREERPDVDQIYMKAVQLMTRQGGWPLNCFTNPEGEPVYGGTYFPKEKWVKVLGYLADLWKEQPDQVNEYGKKLKNGLSLSGVLPAWVEGKSFDEAVLKKSVDNWKTRFDQHRGGSNEAPKFPLPSNYSFLLKYGFVYKDKDVTAHVKLTLDRMSIGGIYDQVGGGFTRYSTDPDWKVPHFEKMLYDNAQLLELYSEAYGAYGDPEYRYTANGIRTWLKAEMRNGKGGYFSALDADSEGKEGQFYVWDPSIEHEVDHYGKYYFTDHRGSREGNFIPVRKGTLRELSSMHGISVEKVEEELDTLNEELRKRRSKRPKPGTDDKTLCSWNAMLISGFIAAYEHMGSESDLEEALSILRFVESEFLDEGELRLLHTWKDGLAKIDGFLEDYAFLIKAYLSVYRVTFDSSYLQKAKELTFQTMDRFYDDKSGVFFFTSTGGESLVSRPVELSDNVIPSSNSVMARNLFELAGYFGLTHFEKCADRLLFGMEEVLIDYGAGYSNWAEMWIQKAIGSPELVVSGPKAKEVMGEIKGFYPLLIKAASAQSESLQLLQGRYDEKRTRIFVCRHHACQTPVESVDDAISQLKNVYHLS